MKSYESPLRPSKGFTLIELLIVVSILAILAVLGAVNYQEAQARGKVSRVHADMRSLASALEAYRTDNDAYPPAAIGDLQLLRPLVVLTSPVAYISSVPDDPFGWSPMDFAEALKLPGYQYKDRVTTSVGIPGETYGYVWEELPEKEFMLHSSGPNKVWDVTPFVPYDPTNGTVSVGDIILFGPM